ncbi:HXXEE domain-containing protein [Bacteroides fragilis]
MLHEFEEIICFKPWIEKNQSWLITKYPLFSKLVAHLNEMSVPTFAMLVLEEFILVSIVTITALTLHWYNIWVAIFTAFAFHILIHIIQWIIIRKSFRLSRSGSTQNKNTSERVSNNNRLS